MKITIHNMEHDSKIGGMGGIFFILLNVNSTGLLTGSKASERSESTKEGMKSQGIGKV